MLGSGGRSAGRARPGRGRARHAVPRSGCDVRGAHRASAARARRPPRSGGRGRPLDGRALCAGGRRAARGLAARPPLPGSGPVARGLPMAADRRRRDQRVGPRRGDRGPLPAPGAGSGGSPRGPPAPDGAAGGRSPARAAASARDGRRHRPRRRALRPVAERAAAREKLGVDAIEIPGGHFPMAEDPEALAALLDRLAREVAP